MLSELGLEDCADTIVGGALTDEGHFLVDSVNVQVLVLSLLPNQRCWYS
jgi:hypothetical protein